jgi:prepilin-type N-terminal cleavage/methylation domain-containing protein
MPRATYACKRCSTRGFSLVEAMVVVVILGVLTLILVPRIEPLVASRAVASARAGFTTLYSRARVAAVQNRRQATLKVDQNMMSATISLSGGGTQAIGGAIRFDSTYGVTATASPTTVIIQSNGLVTTGLPFQLILTRSSAADTVKITDLGRVQ